MAANSENMLDVFIWIKQIINSIVSLQHYLSCKKLIRIFRKKYPKEIELYDDLINSCHSKLINLK
jgi:hypothetical protein